MAKPAGEPIAIVGSACHFAGDVSSPSKLWSLLQRPHDLRREIPENRFSASGFHHPRHSQPGHSNATSGYFMNEDLGAFDADFFGIKPLEAKAIDPQQRWLLETVYEAIEAAGLPLRSLRGTDTGVYVGVMGGDYEAMLLRDLEATPTYMVTGTARSMVSNRISHFFDWRGPSMTIDTACSSSLVAVHLAVQALRAGESRVAVACGSNVILGPENFIVESNLKMLSPDGISKMWDQGANGYARGDGIAAIVLKSLSAALADGDHIECIIRETGTNQDGATPGITVPSATAQQALIRSTYARAGLDILRSEDRPQYFEAHGTGTPAGDPIEAEAIQQAFFGHLGSRLDDSHRNNLYVGSIKTVLGHTESTAGLAGILKASLALQNSNIPPNLHFDRLSDRVAPFYKGLKIPRGNTKEWPVDDSAGKLSCRRASVNSFGFGGSNAHAILESFQRVNPVSNEQIGRVFTPFVFSAASNLSLRANLQEYLSFLSQESRVSAHDLAWTLRQRRSVMAHRVAFSASSLQELRDKIANSLQDDNENIGIRAPSDSKPISILGVFTGQGAQFPRLGAELVEHSKTARNVIFELEKHLMDLPAGDQPSWSLTEELLVSNKTSRIEEAALSQPLCTAVQILLIDLLAIAGIHFDAVVGHSSGEIAAAYAAGHLTARDAILVAYLRGLYVSRATSPSDSATRGAMLAVGTSIEDAQELCNDNFYAGRLSIAACNSSSSVTISGDVDAIEELEELLQDEGKFHRRLRVDTAYHSAHMNPCSGSYVEALQRCNVAFVKASTSTEASNCSWFSSVRGKIMDHDSLSTLDAHYWAENMTRTVLFSQALDAAVKSTDGAGFSVALEVGPHPALRGPAKQTILETLGRAIPYVPTLIRGSNAIEAFSSSLGLLWQHLQPEIRGIPDLGAYERAMTTGSCKDQNMKHGYQVVKGLPTYRWNHSNQYWFESRASRRMRLRQDAFHPLLGHMTSDSSKHHFIWRNLLRQAKDDDQDDELQLGGHRVQGQTVFPAAGYISTAIEAARILSARVTKKNTNLIELQDMNIHQAIVISSDKNEGIEVLVEIADVVASIKSDQITGRFSYSAALANDDELTLVASAQIKVFLGETNSNLELLPARPARTPHLVPVEKERFYTSLAELGYEYAGAFQSLVELRRKHGQASCTLQMDNETDRDDAILLHPAGLDSAFQSLLLAYSYPGDHQLRKLHLPLTIGCVRVNPALCSSSIQQPVSTEQGKILHVDANIIRPRSNGRTMPSLSSPDGGFSGDISVYRNESPNAAIQVLDVCLVPLGGSATKDEDRDVFFETQWVNMVPDGRAAALADRTESVTQKEKDQLNVLKRLAVYYYRQFDAQVERKSTLRLASKSDATACFLQYAEHVLQTLPDDWPVDTLETIKQITGVCDGLPDVSVMHLVGQTMPRVFRGETSMLEVFRETGVLDDYYVNSFSSAPAGRWQTRMVEQIAIRHPHLNILEIGAGTGGTTKPILNALGNRFQSYTFTDISAGFFNTAATTLNDFKDRMIFKTLDIESDPQSQGFQEGTYDLIVASFVLHATASLTRTLANARKLLRPGGFLVVGEGSVETTPVSSFIFGPLPGWWLGRDDGRVLTPHASAETWDAALRDNGFSGIDTRAPEAWEDVLGVLLFCSQAVDEEFRYLRSPLSLSPSGSSWCDHKQAVVVGGKSARVAEVVAQISALLSPFFGKINTYSSLGDVDFELLQITECPVLSLTDLDKPVFKDMTDAGFVHFQKMFQTGKTLLWVSSGRLAEEPFSNMVVGFGRTAVHETPGLNLQHFDLADTRTAGAQTSRILAEAFLRLVKQPRSAPREGMGSLWTVEPEVSVDATGCQRAARLLPLPSLNDRFNSGHRIITREVAITNNAVALCQRNAEAGGVVLEKMQTELASAYSRLLTLEVRQAVVPAIRTRLGPRFLAMGFDATTGTAHLALITSLATLVQVRREETLILSSNTSSNEHLLMATANQLIAFRILDQVSPGQTLVISQTPESLAESIQARAVSKGVKTVFISSQGATLSPKLDYLHLPRYLSKSEVWQQLPSPSSIACFFSMRSGDIGPDETDAMILSGLEAWCRVESSATILSMKGCQNGPNEHLLVHETLHDAFNLARKNADDFVQNPPVVVELEQYLSRSDLLGDSSGNPLKILDLQAANRLPVQIKRLDASGMMFKPDKTYWVVGLSGDLGISLCDWMINTGLRNLVLTSRKPNIEKAWISSHERKGVNITVLPCDITNHEDLVAAHATICKTQPPIAGVLNGAMVLRDTSIRNMTFSQLDEVVRPKVTGSINLDQIFSGDEIPLDFFVLFSSTNFTIGNQGQANYAAANAFQCALAASRRRRGLAGTAVNIGAIIGAGYIQRSTNYKRVLDLTITRGNMMHLSEEDFHQLIAEAIEAGRPEGDGLAELTTGLLSAEHDTASPPIWFSDPRFSHLICRRNVIDHDSAIINNTAVAANSPAVVRDRLDGCQTPSEFTTVITEAFAAQLRQELQITDRTDFELMEMRSREIGLDSLVSVDIRTWFLKTLGVSIPVLRIMSNNTMASLVQVAVKGFAKASVSSSASIGGETAATTATEGSVPSIPLHQAIREDDDIDWEFETRPPVLDLEPNLLADHTQPIKSTPKVVVLTGITGLIGSHLLNHLLTALSQDGQVICIGLLNPPQPHPDPRVHFHVGDFTLPCLGLSQPTCASIFAAADAVIHVGADTSHLKPYVSLRQANVGSTSELARLCAPRRVPLHYVSTVGVGFFSGSGELRPGPAGGEPKADSEGYTTSKWVCERMLERVSEKAGLPVWIHRPSAVLRLGEDNGGPRARMDWLNGLLRYVIMLRAVPEVRHNNGALNMVFVESVCNSILGCVFGAAESVNGSSSGSSRVTYVHQVGDIVIPLDRMDCILDLTSDVDIKNEQHGEEDSAAGCEVLPMAEWISRARMKGLHPAVLELVESIDDPTKPQFLKLYK